MFAQKFAQFVLKRRMNAALLAIIFAALPYFSWLSAVIVGLYTLRKGAHEGFVVCLWSILPSVVLTFVMKNWLILGSRVFLGSLLVWALTVAFSKKPQWLLTVLLACLAGIVAVLIFHFIIGDTSKWWMEYLSTTAVQFEKSLGMTGDKLNAAQGLAMKIAHFATGINAAIFVFSAIIQLVIARLLDLSLPNAVAKVAEKRTIKMPVWMIAVLIIFFLLSYFGPMLFKDILPLILLPFFVAGLSLINDSLTKRLSPMKMLFVYFALIFAMMLMPFIAFVIIFIAVVDSFIDFRRLSDKRRK